MSPSRFERVVVRAGPGCGPAFAEGHFVIGDLASSGAIPALEAMMRFAGARQRLIAHNIANMTTPGFIQRDVSVKDFQASLAEALESAGSGSAKGPLHLRGSTEVDVAPDGTLTLTPQTPSGGILYHDRNNRSIEQLMKDNAENMGAFRIASELLRSRMQQLRDAIAERVA